MCGFGLGSWNSQRCYRKKALRPSRRREGAGYLIEERGASVGRACRVVGLHRSMWYCSSKKDDGGLEAKLQDLAEQLPHRGMDEHYGRPKAKGCPWGRKRVLRVYRKPELQLRKKRRRRLPSGKKAPLTLPIATNIIWSTDFMHGVLGSGRKFRVLNVVDGHNREAPAVESEYGFPSVKAVHVMEAHGVQRKTWYDQSR